VGSLGAGWQFLSDWRRVPSALASRGRRLRTVRLSGATCHPVGGAVCAPGRAVPAAACLRMSLQRSAPAERCVAPPIKMGSCSEWGQSKACRLLNSGAFLKRPRSVRSGCSEARGVACVATIWKKRTAPAVLSSCGSCSAAPPSTYEDAGGCCCWTWPGMSTAVPCLDLMAAHFTCYSAPHAAQLYPAGAQVLPATRGLPCTWLHTISGSWPSQHKVGALNQCGQ